MKDYDDKDERPRPMEVRCPKCGHTQIIYIPKEQIPRCPNDNMQMMMRELLEEGKVI